MEAITIDNREQIQNQLKELGFDDVGKILSTARPLYTDSNSSPVGFSLTYPDKDIISNSFGYRIEYRKILNSWIWEPESSYYTIKIPTRRKPEGYKSVSRYWFASDGPLPHKDYMAWIVNKAAKIETAKEVMLSDWIQKPSAPNRVTGSPPLMHSTLKSDLDKLGFQMDNRWTQTNAFADGFIFLTSREPINIGQPGQHDQVQLFIAVANADLKIPPRIEYLNAAVLRSDLDNRRIISDEDYWLNKGDLPTKEEMLRSISTRLNMRHNRLSSAANIASRIAASTKEEPNRIKMSRNRSK